MKWNIFWRKWQHEFKYGTRCRLAFRSDGDEAPVQRVRRLCPDPFACELVKTVKSSPGPVKDAEELHFLITDPPKLLQDGTLHPAVVKQLDLGGLSTLRHSASLDQYEATLRKLNEGNNVSGKPRRRLTDIVVWSARDIRGALCDGNRIFGIFDTALDKRSHHADIMAFPNANSKNQAEKQKRILIRDVSFKSISYDDFIRDKVS